MALVVQGCELVGAERELGIGLAVVVAELDFVHAGVQHLDHRAHFPGPELARREVFQQGHRVEQFDQNRFPGSIRSLAPCLAFFIR